MRNFYHSYKFCTLTISFSEIWPRQILLKITVCAVRLRNVLNTSLRLANKNSLTWSYVMKTPWRYARYALQDVWKTSWRQLEDVLKTSWRTSWRCLEDVLKTSWRCLEDVFVRHLKTSWKRPHQDEYLVSSQCILQIIQNFC